MIFKIRKNKTVLHENFAVHKTSQSLDIIMCKIKAIQMDINFLSLNIFFTFAIVPVKFEVLNSNPIQGHSPFSHGLSLDDTKKAGGFRIFL